MHAICTVFAKNYLSRARTLCRSILAHNPAVKCYALILDEWDGYIKVADEPFEVVSPGALGIADLTRMSFKYDLVELATAVKPYLLRHLLTTRGIERLFYLDPDILVTNPLDKLFDTLDHAECVVTPHLDVDYPDDGLLPNDSTILLHGIYNLGCFGVRRGTAGDSVLRWWEHKLENKCVRETSRGYYVDQRLIDLAISLFPCFHIEHDTGYNVAYWNLHSRHLSCESGIWRCNGGPLYFFHFSGLEVENQESVSQGTTRHTLATRRDLGPLFGEYRRLLIENGYYESRQWPYTFGHFRNGDSIPRSVRLWYRAALENGLQTPDPFASPEVRRMAVRWEAQQRRHTAFWLVKDEVRNVIPAVLRRCFRCFRNWVLPKEPITTVPCTRPLSNVMRSQKDER
jgi:hypothetical protein